MSPTDPCSTCALGKSGGAADESRNKLIATICAMSGRPFFCHHTRDGAEFDWKSGGCESDIAFLQLPPRQRRVCQGWRRAVARLVRFGHFSHGETAADRGLLLGYQRSLGAEALRALDEVTSSVGAAKKVALAKLKDRMRALKPEGPTS